MTTKTSKPKAVAAKAAKTARPKPGKPAKPVRAAKPKPAPKARVAPRKTTASEAVAVAAKKREAKPKEKKAPKKIAAPKLPPRKLEEFKERLLAAHREMLDAYTSAKGDSRSRQADGTEDYIDYAVSSYDREFLLSLTELDRKQLVLVEEALKRIERREFGECLQCGQPIPVKRLEVQPWARYCVTCQEMDDAGQLVRSEFDFDEGEEAADEETAAEDEPEDDAAAEAGPDEEVEVGGAHEVEEQDDDD